MKTSFCFKKWYRHKPGISSTVSWRFRYSFLLILITTAILMSAKVASAQGCSDAGFCSVGSLHQQGGESLKLNRNKITISLPVGLGDENVVVFVPGVQYEHTLNKQLTIQAKLTTNYATGNLGNAAGFGDVFLSGIYTFKQQGKWITSATLGTKLPLNKSNLKAGGYSLPMQYQSSLGTIDLITGLSISNKNWQFAAGWQKPLTGANNNRFLPEDWDNDNAQKYAPSNNFKRKADVLLRCAYTYKPTQKLSLNGGLLGIYHLSEDTYNNMDKSTVSINGSQGLTLNVTLAAWYQLNKKTTIGFTAGGPLTVRKIRPDGLTRSFVFAPEISWNF